jgi:tetratricopeptide (TPR) repeat protein
MEPGEYKDAGNRLFKDGQWKEAIEQYTKGLEAGGGKEIPGDIRGLLLSNRCQCYFNLNEWQAALDDADAGLQLLPSLAKLILRRANAYEKLGKNSEALVDYAKVARMEPKNMAAVQSAKRLRDDVLSSSQQKRDEVLPAHLIEVLKKSDSTSEARIDACNKLRGLCVHKSLGGSILQAGALDVLLAIAHDGESDSELRRASLAVLAVMASGHEAQEEDEDDAKCPVAPPSFDKPLEVPKSAAEARRQLKDKLDIEKLRQSCRSNANAFRYFSLILGHISKPEDSSALEALNDAMQFPEGAEVDVPRAGLTALATLCDTRRRLGTSVKAVMPTASLLKCIESALGCTSCTELLNSFLAGVFALLGDKDRSKKDEIDLPSLGLKILEPFLQAQDVALKANGLAGLATLFAASAESASVVLHSSPAPLAAILNTLSKPDHGPDGKKAQNYAAECLLLTTGNLKTRKSFIEGGGIDMMLTALSDEQTNRGLIRAKLIGVLSMLAAHDAEVREEVFDRLDFLMELRCALDAVRESLVAARSKSGGAPTMEEARRLARGLYESCACLTIHGEFKSQLQGAKKTMKAMHELVNTTDLTEDPTLAFMYTTIMYNLCRSREDKLRPKKDQFPFNELGEDDLNALEEFYEKMPQESRPVKNGEIDAGSPELATELRAWCVEHCSGAASVVSNLTKCIASRSARVCNLAALTLRFLCINQSHRRHIVIAGGVRLALGLVDLEDETSRSAAQQALAQICISTNPGLLNYRDQLDAIRPLVDALAHKHELWKFEAAMGLTNLLSASDEIRTRAVQANAWSAFRDLLFEENEMVQRAGIEAMCNLTMAEEILERFVDGKCELEIRVFLAFCRSEDAPTQLAASGALAMLTQYPQIAPLVAANEKFDALLLALEEATDSGLEHRIVSCLGNICETAEVPSDVITTVRNSLRERRTKGFASSEAKAIASSALDQGTVSAGGA